MSPVIICMDAGNLTVGFDVEEMVVLESAGDITLCVTATATINGVLTMRVSILDTAVHGMCSKLHTLVSRCLQTSQNVVSTSTQFR